MELFIDRAKRIINQNQELLNALEDFDRTGKLRKAKYKGRVNFTLDEDLINKFRSYCKKNNLKMSTEIEALIREDLGKHNESIK